MRLIVSITERVQIRWILEQIGVDTRTPRIAPARVPPLREDSDAQGADGAVQGARLNRTRTGVNQRRWHRMTRPIGVLGGERVDRRGTRTMGRPVPVEPPGAATGRMTVTSGPNDARCLCRRW